MYEKKLDTYYLTLDEETILDAETRAMRRMEKMKEGIKILQKLEALDGMYLTKRADDKIKALFPEYEHAYLSGGGHYDDYLYVTLYNDQYRDGFTYCVGDKKTRRGNLKWIKDHEKRIEEELTVTAESLAVFRENIAQWNNLMKYAATLYGPIYQVARHSKEYQAEKLCRL